jgi:purine-binding chemotaxis protein CheW
MQTHDNMLQVVAFRLTERLFGVPVQDVKEVNADVKTVAIPHAPGEILGYTNIRGQILLVVDIRGRFGLNSRTMDRSTRLIVFKNTVAEPFGILVDSVDDILSLDMEQVAAEKNRSIETEEIAIGTYPLAHELLQLLQPRAILSNPASRN